MWQPCVCVRRCLFGKPTCRCCCSHGTCSSHAAPALCLCHLCEPEFSRVVTQLLEITGSVARYHGWHQDPAQPSAGSLTGQLVLLPTPACACQCEGYSSSSSEGYPCGPAVIPGKPSSSGDGDLPTANRRASAEESFGGLGSSCPCPALQGCPGMWVDGFTSKDTHTPLMHPIPKPGLQL